MLNTCVVRFIILLGMSASLARAEETKGNTELTLGDGTKIKAQSFTSADKSYTLAIPASWVAVPQPNPKLPQMFGDPDTAAGDDGTPDSLNVFIDEAGKSKPADVFAEVKKGLPATMPKYKQVAEKATKLGRLDGFRLDFDAEPNGKPIRMVQYIAFANGKLYMLHFLSARERATKFVPLAEQIAASFTPGSAGGVAAAADSTAYENKEHHFHLTYPAQLKPTEPASKLAVLFLGTESDGPGDIFRESVTVKRETAKPLPGLTFDQAFSGFVGSMKKNGMKILKSSAAELGGVRAQRLVYTRPLTLPGGTVQVKAVMYFVYKKDQPYSLDIRATEQTFDSFEKIAQPIVDSFRWDDVQDGK